MRSQKILAWIEKLFAFWVLIFALVAFLYPDPFAGARPAIVPALGVIMLGMGLTLTVSDFARVFRRPQDILLGVFAQYAIMPLAGFAVATVLRLDPQTAAGVILVGSCPGGTASNVITYLARADVALSVTLTACSTLLAPVLTPALMELLAGTLVPVPAISLLVEIFKVVVLPVVAGLLVRHLLGARVQMLLRVLPLATMACIGFIVAVIVGLNAGALRGLALPVFFSVALHNGMGFALGYGMARAFRADRVRARTISIEVGMQNSGLAVALATKFFSPAAALPGAFFSVWHNLAGTTLANYWSRRVK